MINLSDRKKQELYNQELILKFMAFYNNIDNINLNTEQYLNQFMENTVQNIDYDYNEMKDLFIETLSLIQNFVDEPTKVFYSKENRFVATYFDAITVSVAQNIDKYKNNPQLLREKIEYLKQDSDFKYFSGTAPSSRSRVKKRLQRANEIFSN